MKFKETCDGGGNVKALDIYIMDDDPVNCPKCGRRTKFETFLQDDASIVQRHDCPDNNCRYEFIVEEDIER